MSTYINHLPDLSNENIKKLISILKIESEPFYVNIFPDKDAVNGFCNENVSVKIQNSGGDIVNGWYFREYKFMVEAEFHSIWKSPEGKLFDITPSQDPSANKILFVIDESRTFDVKYRDNFRLNTTGNKLVDDFIELKNAQFRFDEKIYDENGNLKLDFTETHRKTIEEIVIYSEKLEEMCNDNLTIDSKCFCNSRIPYEFCHRDIIKRLLATI